MANVRNREPNPGAALWLGLVMFDVSIQQTADHLLIRGMILMRHLLEELHGDGGAFEKVRQEMAKREGNRYDYTKQLTVQERVNETGNGEQIDAAQAELPGI